MLKSKDGWCIITGYQTTISDVQDCNKYIPTPRAMMAAQIKELEKQRDALVEALERITDAFNVPQLDNQLASDERDAIRKARIAIAMVEKKEGE